MTPASLIVAGSAPVPEISIDDVTTRPFAGVFRYVSESNVGKPPVDVLEPQADVPGVDQLAYLALEDRGKVPVGRVVEARAQRGQDAGNTALQAVVRARQNTTSSCRECS